MKLLSRSTLVLFILTASALRCTALTYAVGPGLGVALPDDAYNGTLATMASVQISIPDSATIADINVTIGMNHTWIGDLVIKLKSPSGTIVTLMSRPGKVESADDGNDTGGFGESSNLVIGSSITYDDSAVNSAEDMGTTPTNLGDAGVNCQDDAICSRAPNPGAALPGNLANFNGENTSGTWTLYVGDAGTGDTGSIDSVSISIVPAAATDCIAPPSGMIAWWPADENAFDIAGIHNGTFQDSATIGAGKVGSGFSFDGTDDHINVGDVDLPVTFTVDAWINPTSLTGGPFIISKDNGNTAHSYYLQVFAGGSLEAVVRNAAAGVTEYTSTTSPVTTGSWQHVAMTYDGNAAAGSKIKFYYNGALLAATVQGGQDAGGTPNDIPDATLIGTFVPGLSEFTGGIDEVELFNRVLDSGEIQSIFAADTVGKCKPEIYVSNSGSDSIQQFDADAFGTSFASTGMDSPTGLAFDAGGSLFVANHDNGSILKFDSNGTSTTFVAAGNGPQFFTPYGIAFDNAGNLFAADPGTNKIIKFDPSSSFSTFADSTSGLIAPVGVAFDGAGNLYVANFGDGTIIKFDPQGTVSPVADIGGATEATDIAFDTTGNLFVAAQTVNKIFKIDTNNANAVTEFADSTDGVNNPFGLAFDRFGNLFVLNKVNTAGPEILKFDAAGNHVIFTGSAGLNVPAFIEIKPGIVPLPAPTPVNQRFVNISTRASVGTGDNVAIAGFIPAAGEPTSPRPNALLNPKKVLIRGLGPSLNVLGTPVVGRLADPVLDLHAANGSLITSNDNWRTDQETEIEQTGLAPSDDNEAAIVVTLESDAVYTAILKGAGNTTGIGLVEVYDLDPLGQTHLANISTRGQVLTNDDVLIGGIIVRGGEDRQIIFRALGPSLANFNINSPLSDPKLEIHNAQGALIDQNDNWRSDQESDIQATGLAPTDDAEAAILYSDGLVPGNYTAIVSGVGGVTGIGMVEAYRLGPPSP
jgi:subtilisin-like proprotein convertase family protein/sugar lactone lactonase YvrE